MKKNLVAVLLLVGLLAAGQPAFAVSTTVDFAAAMDTLAVLLGPDWASTASEQDGNGMLDAWELKVVSDILFDAGDANHGAVYAAWTTNYTNLSATIGAAVAAVFGPTRGVAVSQYLAGMALIGDGTKLTWVRDSMVDLGMPLATADAIMASLAAPVAGLGKADNLDGDAYTNFEEYGFASDAADYSTRAQTSDVPPTLSVTISKTPNGVIASGTSVTFTAVASAGTAPYTYVWKKDGAPTGGTASTETITAAVVDSGASFTCDVQDSVSAIPVTSNALTLTVLDSSNLPAMGIAGIALLIGLAGALGVRKIRK